MHKRNSQYLPFTLLVLAALAMPLSGAESDRNLGVEAKPIPGAEVILDGSRKMLDAKWTYWEGPRFAAALPILKAAQTDFRAPLPGVNWMF